MKKLAVGTYPAVVTPFSKQGDVMPDAFAEILRWHLDNGAKGFLIAGDNGEHWALTPNELGQLTAIAMRETKGRLPVYIGAWAISERETIARAEAAANAGAYGLCVKPAFYVHTWAAASRADIVGRFAAVAKAVPLPMMVYNSPNRTGVNITQDDLRAICEVAEVEALKDNNYDTQHQLQNVLQFHDRIAVMVSGGFFMTGMLLGATGTIGSPLEFFGGRHDRVFEFESMSQEERRTLHRQIIDVKEVMSYTGTVPAPYKAALNLLGLPAGYPREPIRPLTPEEETTVRNLLAKYGAPVAAPAARRRAS